MFLRKLLNIPANIAEKTKDFCTKIKTFHTKVINEGVEEGLRKAQLQRKTEIKKEICIYNSVFNKAKTPVLNDIKDVKTLPKDISNVWKEQAPLMTKTKNTYQQAVKPHLPGVCACVGAVLPFPGVTSSGYFVGQLIKHFT